MVILALGEYVIVGASSTGGLGGVATLETVCDVDLDERVVVLR